jgi:hypothetical protein
LLAQRNKIFRENINNFDGKIPIKHIKNITVTFRELRRLLETVLFIEAADRKTSKKLMIKLLITVPLTTKEHGDELLNDSFRPP